MKGEGGRKENREVELTGRLIAAIGTKDYKEYA